MTLPACTGADSKYENYTRGGREGVIMYHHLCLLRVPLGGARSLIV